MTFNQVWVNRRVVHLSSSMTEQTGAASQARAKPTAHTRHIREISPTAILVRHNCDIYKTPSFSLKTSPPDRATRWVPCHQHPQLQCHSAECLNFCQRLP